MAEAEPIIASAIVVPDAPEHPTPSEPSPGPGNSLKRRQSSTSENDSKRPRLSRDGSNEPPKTEKVDDGRRDARRKSGQVEERKRGQRLFGALLGTLSQSSSSSAVKRRADIEKRQQAKLKQQAEEDSQRQLERLEELKATRRREQVKLDEQAMRVRHSNLLNMANFLQTTAEPRLYYKPWELLPEHEEKIKRQIEDAQATIDQELDDWEQNRAEEQIPTAPTTTANNKDETMEDATVPTALEPLQQVVDEKNGEAIVSTLTTGNLDPTSDETMQKQKVDEPEQTHEYEQPPEEEQVTTGAEPEAEMTADDIADEHQGEMVVEAEEDTVIY